MEMIVGVRLGGLKCTIAEDMKNCEIEGIGKAGISYCSINPHGVIINNIEINPYAEEENENFYALADKACIKVKKFKPGSGQNGFSLSDEQKKIIANEIKRKYDNFLSDIKAKKIRIYVSIVGCDFPHAVLKINEKEYEGMNAWNFFYIFTDTENHIYNAYKWLANEKQVDGLDVTDEVAQEIERRTQRKIEKEEKRKAVFDEAKRIGKKIKLYSYTDECRSKNEDCSTDIITRYAMPDGSEIEEVTHTY